MPTVALDATPLLGQPTGVGAFVAGALAALASDTEFDVSAYALSLRGWRALRGVLPEGVRSHWLPLPAGALMRAWSRSDRPAAVWLLGPVDVVHGTNFVVPPHRAAVVTVHDLTPMRFPELANPSTALFPTLVRRAVARGAWVHTPSRFVAEEVIDLLGVPAERVVAVHHGVPPVEPADGRRPPVDGPYVLALGTVEPRKDLPSLVRAFEAVRAGHPDLRLVVAGPAGWGDLPEAPGLVAMGFVTAPVKATLLRHAAVCAYPSRYEGFGFPPLEAMAVGTPVVATAAGALPEVLGDGAVFVEPGDSDALAGAIERVLADDGLRAGLVDRGRRRAATFDWGACAAGLASLYRRVAA